MKIPINWLEEFVEIPSDLKKLTHDLTMVGHMLDKIEEKNGETILDLELRGNRADCYSILGIAREVSAIYGNRVKTLQTVLLTKVKKLKNISLNVKTPFVKRVGMVEVKDVKIMKSPKWLSDKLTNYGMESINNIVDLTNYVMIETGEPIHAFDLDKVGDNIEIRLARDGEKITTFTDGQIKLTHEDLVWASGPEGLRPGGQVLSIAGAVGEKYNSISDSTKNILIEAANYNRANIRRMIYRHKLLTEAGIRHEKNLDPNIVDLAISRFLYLIKKYNWGKFNPEVYDYYPSRVSPCKINLTYNYLKTLGGVDIKFSEIKNILSKLQFEVVKKDKEELTVLIPTYRTDVILTEDLIEEIIRIYGYDNIPTKTLALEIPKNVTLNYILQEEKFRNSSEALGFDEVISLSFIKKEYLDKNIPVDKGNLKVVSIQNPPSPDTRYLRATLFPNLLDSTLKIINDRGEVAQLFEIGKIYLKNGNRYIEKRKIGLISWNENKKNFSDFKSLVHALFAKMGIKSPEYLHEILNITLSDSYVLKFMGKEIGFGGKLNDIYYIEIDLDMLLGQEKKYNMSLWPKFPPQIEDLTFTIPAKTYIGNVMRVISELDSRISNLSLKDIFSDSYTFNLEYQDPDKTLTNDEVEKIRNKILSAVKSKFGASIKS
ncbi:MAG: phenylalanine--tRNA ligase subunit beta [Patescibacteria group bacterium]